MLAFRNTWLMPGLLVLAAYFASVASVSAGAKKPGDKGDFNKVEKAKDEASASAPVFTTKDELTAADPKDTKHSNSPRKLYKVKLIEGKSYQIDLKSKDFDAVLRLETAAGQEVAYNDDFEPTSLDSRIVYKAGKTGAYQIIATSLDGKMGKFSLVAVEVTGADAVASVFKGQSLELKAKDGKGTYAGELTDDDASAAKHYYKLFTIRLEKGKVYRIDHRSDDFDAYLFLEDAAGNRLAQDDDSGGGLNARIVFKVKATDTYRIVATTMPPNKTGKFSLAVVPGNANDVEEATFNERLASLATASPAEVKNVVRDFTKRLQAKGEALTINDARQAMVVANALEDTDIDQARAAYEAFIKAFAEASNKQVATIVTRSFEGSLKKLAILGKEFEITGTTVDGKDFDLKDLKGKVVLVDFWATWCGPCIGEIPNMLQAYEKYRGKGFEIIGVSLDRTDEAIVKFNEKRKLPWNTLNIEDSRKWADKYGVNAIPFPVLVDASGRVISIRARGPQLEVLLARLLGEKK